MIRIGHGYDVHKLVENRKLILGGVDIPFCKGLDGHSDADVVIHALIDAILGALAIGDIGKLYPDNDDKYLNADSMCLLADVNNIINNKGYKIGNADCTIIAQQPKLSAHIKAMRQNIAKAVNTNIDYISVKATTEEHLGFTGEGLGIAAHAVVILEEIK